MIKKLFVIIVSLMLMTNPLITSYVSAEVDNQIPQVDSLVLNQEVYNVGDVIEVKAKITDQTGVKAAKVEFRTPAGFNRGIWLDFNLVTGLWEGTYEVLSTDEAGVWTSSYMYLSDTAENYGSINPALTLTVVNTGETDSEIPEVIDLQINSNEIQVGDFIIIKAQLKDTSGVKAAKVEFKTPSGFSRGIWLEFNPASNLWEGNYQIGVNDEGGEWISTYMYLSDQLGNYGSINPSLKVNIINSGVVDNKIPEVKNLKLNAHEFYEYGVGDLIEVKAEITDDSGVNAVKVELRTPSRFSRSIWLKYNPETQLWEGYYEIKPTDEPGEWTSTYMFLQDNAGNYGSINPNLKIKVVNPGDHSVPSLKNISLDKNEVTAGNSVKVSVNTTNDHEVNYLYLYYSTHDSSTDLTVTLKYNAETNAFEGVIPILSSYQSGEYSTKRVTLYTANDSVDIHYPEPLKDGGFIVNNTNAGEVIKSISLSKTDVGLGDTVNFTLNIADDEEGIDVIVLYYYTPEANKSLSIDLKYNPNTDSFEGSFPIQDYSESGEYSLWRVGIYSNNYTRSFSGTEYQEMFSKGNFNVTGTTGVPLIESISVDKKSATVGEKVNIKLKASDPVGIRYFLLWYTTPISAKTVYVNMYYNLETGYFEGNIPVEVNSELGEYRVNRVGVYYPSGNIYSLDYTDTLVDGYFTVVSDKTAPIITRVNEITDKDSVLSGEAEVNTEITVQVNGSVIGTGTVGTDGKFHITIPVQSAGTLLEVTATDKSGNISAPVKVTVKDGTAPNKPEVSEVNDQSTAISGKAEAGSRVEVKSESTVIGSSIAKEDGSFTIEIPVQKVGIVLEVSATDEAGNVSEVVQVTVKDDTAPSKPEVNEVNDQSTTVSGKAEAGAKVEVKIESTVVGSSIAEEDGSFTIEMPVQKTGAVLEISATDEAGNVSEVVQVTVKDISAPRKPEVSEVNDQSTAISGKTEAGSKVEVKSESTVIGSSIAKEDGSFTIEIPVQKAGIVLEVSATDEAGNMSEVVQITVKDITAPNKPEVNEVNDQSTAVSGKAEAGSKVDVKTEGTVISSSIVEGDGSFIIDIPVQKAGAVLEVSATDEAGNLSEVVQVTVKDATAPSKPEVNEVNDQSTAVSGKAEVGSKVEVKSESTVVGSSIAKEDGSFTIEIPVQKAGIVLEVSATDEAGNVSEVVQITVKDISAPSKPEANEVNDLSTTVSGKAESGSKVEVKSESTVVGSSTAKEDESFTIEIPVQKAGAMLEISATDEAGNVSEMVQVTVKDATAPSIPEVNEVNDQSTTVSGKAEAESKVEITSESTVVGSSIAKEDGSFTIEIPVQKAGAELMVTATDAAGNQSDSVIITVKDVTAPSKPEVHEITEESQDVSGKAEKGSKVEVMSGDNVLGSGITDANGSFSIEIPLQKAGVELNIFASDRDGNKSEAAKITVKDITAPKEPTVNEVTDQTSIVKGTAEAGSKIEVITGNQILGSTVAAENGDYSITIAFQKAGSELIIVSEDIAGNRSDEIKIVVKDVTTPNKPVVSEVTEKSTQIAGTAEPGAKVEVKVNQNVIGTATVDDVGDFVVNIQAQPAGTVLMITVTDPAGNKSEPETISVKSVVQTGWMLKENNWFYFIDGQLVTGWKLINSKWYFFDSNGVMITGWLKSGTKWYFLDGSGAMKTGWLKSGGKWYYLAASGEMKTGWLKVGITWYYFDGSGAMKTGWIQSGGKWYYLYSSGAMAYNTTIGSYKLGKDGAWIR